MSVFLQNTNSASIITYDPELFMVTQRSSTCVTVNGQNVDVFKMSLYLMYHFLAVGDGYYFIMFSIV